MNCANHSQNPAVAYCRTCGKPLCSNCTRQVMGVIYCENCLAERMAGSAPPANSRTRPRSSHGSAVPRPRRLLARRCVWTAEWCAQQTFCSAKKGRLVLRPSPSPARPPMVMLRRFSQREILKLLVLPARRSKLRMAVCFRRQIQPA